MNIFKKWTVILMVLSLVASVSAVPVAAVDTTEELIGELEPIEPVKLDTKTPCYGDYEIIVNEDEYNTMSAEQRDSYESNNSFSAATLLNSYEGEKTNYVNADVTASLHRETWLFGLIEREVDEDYYRFDLFGKATVSISLTNIPSDCDYDLKLYQHDNIRYAQDDDITQIAASTRTSNTMERISMTLGSGTYYIWIYSYNEECNDSAYYDLALNCTYTARDEKISSLRYNKGAKAALWVSDYDPCGIAPYSSNSKEEVGYVSLDTPTSYSFQNPFNSHFTSGAPVEQSVLYLWDPQLRRDLRAFLAEYYNEINNELQADIELLMKWEFINDSYDNAGTYGGIAISFVKADNVAVEVLESVFTYGPIIYEIVKNIFAPSEEAIISKADLLSYITNIRTALEVGNNADGNEVIRLAYTYSYSTQNYAGTSVISYNYDFTPSLQSNYIYNSDIISSWSESTIVNGTIYGIIDENDFENAVTHGSNTLPDVNTSTIRTLNLDSSIPGELNLGEYHWYRFTAPTSGTYAFYTENSIDTYGELFSSVVPGSSTTGRLAYNDDIVNNVEKNFRIEYQLSAGQTVYLRVSGYNRNIAGLYTLRATMLA